MTKKIFRSILLTSLAVMLIGLSIAIGCLYYYFGNILEQRLDSELTLAAEAVEESGMDFLERLNTDNELRLTLVDKDGTVLFDMDADATSMENHADREEIREAFATGRGESSRYSSTLTEKTIYHAILLENGTVLRISVSRATVLKLIDGIATWFILAAILAAVLSWFLAKHLSKRIITPLNQVDLENPLENDTYEELSPLLCKIYRQHQQIDFQILQLRQKTDEFEYITSNMKEGLVLLDSKGKILSINEAAAALFEIRDDPVGADFLSVERSHEMSQANAIALETGHATFLMERNGRNYQLEISRIESASNPVGLVILAFDVSEREYAERARKEFTANVSHELRTPLTSIIAGADLINNNLVAQKDMPRFIGHIREEASRLLTLVEDIIRLSQLDEGIKMTAERIDLGVVAGDAIERLRDTAEKSNVKLELTTDYCPLEGFPQLLYEIIYNLVENAIKYNIPGGKVSVSVDKTTSGAVLKVADTGIGIPAIHQDRIFERFYRVDKSHSRESGGTGLGLSIVKHAASYFNAEISLQSEVGKGTTITVFFPYGH